MKRFLPIMTAVLAGCAQLPHDLPPRPSLQTPEAAATMVSLAGTLKQLERDDSTPPWWQDFGLADLDRLITTALHNQPDLAATQARLAAADRAERLARLDTEVHYSTDASIMRERLSENGLFPPPIGGSTFTQTDLTQNLAYNIDWWGKNRALLRAAGNETQAARDENAAMRLAIAAAVADAYFAWADVDARLDLARQLAGQHRMEQGLLKTRLELGLDSAQPMLDIGKTLNLDEDRIRTLEYLDRSWRYRMSALIGSDPDHAADLPTPTLAARLPDLPASLPLGWLARRPDVAALRDRVEAAAAQSDATRAEFYPNLDLKMMIGLETLDLAKLFQSGSLSASVGPALHLPLFNSHTLQARLGLREADYAGAVAAYNKAILEAARQSADAYALAASLEQRNEAQSQALKKTEQSRSLLETRQALGLVGPLDTLTADNAVLDQRMSNIETQAARLRARVALFKAIGGDTTIKD